MMTQDLHTLTGPYALDALPQEEAEAFEEHLEACAACRAELREFRETAALLGDAVAVTPPPSLRQSVLAEIAVTRQDAPKVVPITRAASFTRRFAMPAAAAVAVIALGLAVALGSLTSRINQLEDRDGAFRAVLASSDAILARGGGAEGQATLVASPSSGQAVVAFSNLDRAPDGHVYELWTIGESGPVPAGLFDADDHGTAIAVMKGDMTGVSVVAVTVEPAGGSMQPTTVPFLTIALG